MISLVSFTQHNYFEIHACCIVHCFLLMYSILLYGNSIHLLISRHLSSFLILTIWNKTAINIFVFEWTYTFTSPGWWNSWILWRFPGGGHGSPLHYSCLENLHGQRSLVGYSPWGRKESDMTDHLSVTEHTTHLLSTGHIFVSHRSTPSFLELKNISLSGGPLMDFSTTPCGWAFSFHNFAIKQNLPFYMHVTAC